MQSLYALGALDDEAVADVVGVGRPLGAESFNQPLDKWDVSHATLGWMFDCAVSFNQPLHAPWYDSSSDEESESE